MRGSLYSQNGEDGILIELLRRIGSPVFRSIEMCCEGSGGNTGLLAFELGWKSLTTDGSQMLHEQRRSGSSGVIAEAFLSECCRRGSESYRCRPARCQPR